jgi:mobilization protein NikA
MRTRRTQPRGRPPRDPARRRCRTLYVYATANEAKLIANRARRAGVSVSYFLGSAGLRPGAIKMVPPINREAFASLSRIGGLLNQLDRHLNAGIQVPFGGPLPDLFELSGLLLLVRQQLLGLDSK